MVLELLYNLFCAAFLCFHSLSWLSLQSEQIAACLKMLELILPSLLKNHEQ